MFIYEGMTDFILSLSTDSYVLGFDLAYDHYLLGEDKMAPIICTMAVSQ